MSPVTLAANQILGLLTLISQIIVALLFIGRLLKIKTCLSVIDYFRINKLLFTLIIALNATLGSLFYSEISGFEPCKLCWFQRIMMYPQAIILILAFITKDDRIKNYLRLLSLIGISISIYHVLMQWGAVPSGSCSVVGTSVSCSKVLVTVFGYITIPMMALTAFGLILILQSL